MSSKIEAVVNEFVNQDKMFTSVDIANVVKERGTWIRNREVAAFLHQNVSLISNGSYTEVLIQVNRTEDGRLVPATLYLPVSADPSDYDATAQKVIGWDDFNQMHSGAAVPVAALVAPTSDDDDDDAQQTQVQPSTDNDPTGIQKAASAFSKFNMPGVK